MVRFHNVLYLSFYSSFDSKQNFHLPLQINPNMYSKFLLLTCSWTHSFFERSLTFSCLNIEKSSLIVHQFSWIHPIIRTLKSFKTKHYPCKILYVFNLRSLLPIFMKLSTIVRQLFRLFQLSHRLRYLNQQKHKQFNVHVAKNTFKLTAHFVQCVD
jgi:hypothetical protein